MLAIRVAYVFCVSEKYLREKKFKQNTVNMSKVPTSVTSKLEARKYPSVMARRPARLSIAETLKNRIKTLENTIDGLYTEINAKDMEIERYETAITCQKAKIKFKLSQECIGDGNYDQIRGQNQILNEKLRNQEILLDVRSKFLEHLLQCDEAVKALVKEKEATDRRFYELECELLGKNELIDVLRSIIAEKVEKLEQLTANPTRDCGC